MPRTNPDGSGRPHPQSENSFIFDYDGMLGRFDGDEPLMSEILSLFLEDFTRQAEVLRGVLASRDWPGTRQKAHALRSACANVGAGSAGYAARLLEEAARDLRTEDADDLFAKLETEFRRFQEAVRKTIPVPARPDPREGDSA